MKNLKEVKSGIYPAMITPYTADNKVDLEAVAAITRWYAERGCDGIFSDCLSSEIYFLSLEERVNIAKTVMANAPEGMDIIISGHTSDDIDEQIYELNELAKLKPAALIFITNRLAKEDEDDEVLKKNTLKLIDSLPDDIPLGLYEAPLPYKRLLSPELLKWFADTGRFMFLKDTSCSVEEVCRKVDAVKGTKLKIFDACTATLNENLAYGAHGYCGVMCNYHPELYAKLFAMKDYDSIEAHKLSNLLGTLSLIQYQMYPLNAKYYLKLLGLPIKSYFCRNRVNDSMNEAFFREADQMFELTEQIKNDF